MNTSATTSSFFPANFTWGAATAAYQIEGAWDADGKKPSIWDHVCHQEPAKIGSTIQWDQATGDVACDHYHRYVEDVALMKQIGLRAYRFSFSWPRLMPDGTGAVNPKGVDFYHRLLDALLEANITPWATLFHWDLPLSLHYRGGWLNRDSVQWFADYAGEIAGHFGDKISHWMTLNEPQCIVWLGLGNGEMAPGWRLPLTDCLRAAHHAMLAHGAAVQALRSNISQPVKIGFAPVGVIKIPASDSPADIEAARRATFATPPNHLWTNSWWMDPVLLGEYPKEGIAHFGKYLPDFVHEGDLKNMCQPLDFFGANIYQGDLIRARAGDGEPEPVNFPVGYPITAYKWNVTPDSLYWGPRFFHERYGKPIVITENGCANNDWVALDGTCPDSQRIDLLRRYLRSLARAASDGVPVHGYFHWSLMDNFEWFQGYKERFGLIHVDFSTQQRTLKDSAHFYREVIATGGANL